MNYRLAFGSSLGVHGLLAILFVLSALHFSHSLTSDQNAMPLQATLVKMPTQSPVTKTKPSEPVAPTPEMTPPNPPKEKPVKPTAVVKQSKPEPVTLPTKKREPIQKNKPVPNDIPLTSKETLALAKTLVEALPAAKTETSGVSATQTVGTFSEVKKYQALITEAIGKYWLIPPMKEKNMQAVLLVRVAPGGTVLGVSIVKSSGYPALDQSAETAVYKASPLPVPGDPLLFQQFREISLTVKPEGVLNV